VKQGIDEVLIKITKVTDEVPILADASCKIM